MLGIHDLPLFIASGLLLNITPGPDMLYIIGRGSVHGPGAGVVAALGVGAGCLVHVTAATLGLSALLAASATAFTMLKLVGAAYLVYVGVGMLLAKADGVTRSPSQAKMPPRCAMSLRRVFVQGFCTNALNPKVALFFLAFLPQFIDPASPHAALAFLILGLLFSLHGTVWNLLVGWSAARVARWLSRSSSTRAAASGRLGRWCNRAVGSVFIYFGIRLATAEA
ncbi:MAG: LysE family translocator [Desulfovibrio sp.]|nr:LysE family translocator [Desulfovibrio sp.]